MNNLHVFAAHPSRSRVGKGPQRVGKAVAGRVVSARSGGTSARAEFRSCTRILRHKKRADDGVEIFTTSRSANATPPHSLAHRIFSKALFVVVGRMALLIRLHRCRVSSAYFRAAAAAVCIMIILIIIIIIMLLCRPLGTVMVMCFDIIIYPVYQLVGNIQCIGVGVVIIDAYYARWKHALWLRISPKDIAGTYVYLYVVGWVLFHCTAGAENNNYYYWRLLNFQMFAYCFPLAKLLFNLSYYIIKNITSFRLNRFSHFVAIIQKRLTL